MTFNTLVCHAVGDRFNRGIGLKKTSESEGLHTHQLREERRRLQAASTLPGFSS
jgi:hypothetical protein